VHKQDSISIQPRDSWLGVKLKNISHTNVTTAEIKCYFIYFIDTVAYIKTRATDYKIVIFIIKF